MKPNISISRRGFLKIAATSGIAILTIKGGLDSLNEKEMICETRTIMGIVVNISVAGLEPTAAHKAIQDCFTRMEELENILSRFKPASQVSKLNTEGRIFDPHPALVTLIKQSHQLSQMTGGAFDVTIKPLLDLYQSMPDKLPDSQQIAGALRCVDYRKINLSERMISFSESGMSITLDGIAKGFIVDESIAILKQHGVGNVLAEAGGDLIALGEKCPGVPWRIGLQSPRSHTGEIIASIGIKDQAVATSGDYMQAFTPDFVNNHIIDPHIGHSPLELASASVFAPTLALADGLATAVMVLGKAGLPLINRIPGCEAFLIAKDLTIMKTSGLDKLTAINPKS
jgi:FAD:protein FMN transferase